MPHTTPWFILADEVVSSDTPGINEYAHYLKGLYGDYIFPVNEWPPMLSVRYIDLALINHQSIPKSSEIDDFMKSTLHGTGR